VRPEGSETKGRAAKPPPIAQTVMPMPPANPAYLKQIVKVVVIGMGRASNTTYREEVVTLV